MRRTMNLIEYYNKLERLSGTGRTGGKCHSTFSRIHQKESDSDFEVVGMFTKEWNATWFKRFFNCLALSGLPEF